jgi:hypothetical protein
MAERKTPARKGPTRAAALKALGLTAADLRDLKEAAKELAELKMDRGKSDATECACGPNQGCTSCPPAKFENSRDPQKVLEDRPAPHRVDLPDTEEEPVWYVRNLRHVDVGFRLTRQQKQGEKRTNLKPRGSRGDMLQLQQGDLKDPELQTQVGYGLVEVIPEGEARAAISKQFTNQQTQVPAHIASLRNPKGEAYEQANPVRIASDDEAYGVKVADLDPALMRGELSDTEIKRGGGFADPNRQGMPQNTSPGGNPAIISDGFMAPAQGDSSQMGNNDQRSQQVDALARSGQFEGPGAGLGRVNVTVEPVRRVQ